MRIPAIKIAIGEVIPKWYYGYSYQMECQHIYIFHPFPLNYFVRWIFFTKQWFLAFRKKPNYFDKMLQYETKELLDAIKKLSTNNLKLRRILFENNIIVGYKKVAK